MNLFKPARAPATDNAPARFQIERTILHKSRAACKMVCEAGERKLFASLSNEFRR